jgi:NADH-quinone oxidoreductase subunit E
MLSVATILLIHNEHTYAGKNSLMLSADEQREIDEELAHHEHRRGACIEALKIVQRRRGWVSDDALRDIAGHVGMAVEDLEGVATFYNLIFRKPVGRHVIYVCDSVSCWIRNVDAIKEHLTRRLGIDYGGTTSDNAFTLLPIQCLGTCDHAPALMVDGELYRDLTVERIDAILEDYRVKDQANGTTAHEKYQAG